MYRSPTTYASRSRLARLPHQAYSYHAQDTPPSSQSSPKHGLVRSSKVSASVGRSNKISRYLFPLISKFEALDALSHEAQILSLRPPPLQISRNSSPQRGGMDVPASTQLDSIFSPRRKDQVKYEGKLVENVMASGLEDIFTSGSVKRSGSGRLKQTQSANKVSNIRRRYPTQQNSFNTVRESAVGTRIQERVGQTPLKGGRENSVVRERILFYDGHTSFSCPHRTLHDPNSAHSSPEATTTLHTNSRHSYHRTVAPTTPHMHQSHCRNYAQPFSRPSDTQISNIRTITTKSCTPQTPSEPRSIYRSQRRHHFENVPNPFSQAPHTNPPTRQISPKTTLTGSRPEKYNFIDRRLFETSKVPAPIQKDVSMQEKRSRPRIQESPAKREASADYQRRVSNEKREALHRAKALEKPRDTTSIRGASRDEDIQMLRERGVVAKMFESGPWSVSKASGTRIPRPKWRDFSKTKPLAPPQKACSPNPPKNTTCSKPILKPGHVIETQIPSLTQREQRCPSTPANASCRGIHDKIKCWESQTRIKDQLSQGQEWCPLKNMTKLPTLRKSIFENPWGEEVGKELESRGLNGQEVQAIVNEFQDIERETDHDPRKGKWTMVVTPRFGRASSAAQEKCYTDESADMDMRIIVREAQCGLAEPKPLRLLEMKRMILLCRERVSVGDPVCKDRGRVRIQ